MTYAGMRYTDTVRFSAQTTLSQAETIEELLIGVGSIQRTSSRRAVRWTVESEPNESEFAFAMRLADTIQELRAWDVDIVLDEKKLETGVEIATGEDAK